MAIANRLSDLRIPAPQGGCWHERTVAGILTNEKFAGELLLQKTYVVDHISKKQIKNQDLMPKYHVQNSHPAIIDKETFDRAQEIMALRKEKYHPIHDTPQRYAFSGLIRCDTCGASYVHKTNSIGTKYAKAVWICQTYNRRRKAACDARQIPDDILTTLTMDVLGWSVFSPEDVARQIGRIHMVGRNHVIFELTNGQAIEREWDTASRRASWTDEMKKQARERFLAIREGV